MTGLFASPRRRRRAAWLGGALVLAGAVTFVGIRFSNTGHSYVSPFRPGPVQRPPKSPKPDPFTASEQRQVRAVAVRFISTAVLRKNVDASWEITAPSLRQGLSRSAWATGTIPVVPYPGDALRDVRWRINYSFDRRVGLKVAFYPKPRAEVSGQVFDIELQNFGTSVKPRWLVSDWIPSGGPQVAAAKRSGSSDVQFSRPKSGIRPIWLLVPVVLIAGSLLLLVGALGVRGWIRQSRANRAYSKSL